MVPENTYSQCKENFKILVVWGGQIWGNASVMLIKKTEI